MSVSIFLSSISINQVGACCKISRDDDGMLLGKLNQSLHSSINYLRLARLNFASIQHTRTAVTQSVEFCQIQ